MISSTGSSIPPPPPPASSRRLVLSSNSCFSPCGTGGTRRIGYRLQQQAQQQHLLNSPGSYTVQYYNYNAATDVQLTPFNRMAPISSPSPSPSPYQEEGKKSGRQTHNATPTTAIISPSSWSSHFHSPVEVDSPSFSRGWYNNSNHTSNTSTPSPVTVCDFPLNGQSQYGYGSNNGEVALFHHSAIVGNQHNGSKHDDDDDDDDAMILVRPTTTYAHRSGQSTPTTGGSRLKRRIDFTSSSSPRSSPRPALSSTSTSRSSTTIDAVDTPPGAPTICTVIDTNNSNSEGKKNETRIKTEYCKYILNNETCKFGKLCNFAHDEAELNYKTLFERHDAGLLDKETLRTRPCIDYVSTGSCPFGSRCTSIHDPRIKTSDESKYKWWLPNCLLESKNLNTDVHIDWFRNFYFSDIHYGHGFGGDSGSNSGANSGSSVGGRDGTRSHGSNGVVVASKTASTGSATKTSVLDSFDQFYNFITHRDENGHEKDSNSDKKRSTSSTTSNSSLVHESNKYYTSPKKFMAKGRKNCLTEEQRIEIELIMRTTSSKKVSRASSSSTSTSESTSTALYKYKPSHIIFNEMCMILQKRAFDTSNSNASVKDSNKTTNNIATINEIPVDKYNRHNANHVLVYDISFGLPGPSHSNGNSKSDNSDIDDDKINIGRFNSNNFGRKSTSNRSSSLMKMPTHGNNRPRALYFHIHEEDVRECTYQERMNYKKTCQRLERLRNVHETKMGNIGGSRNGRSSYPRDYSFIPKSFDITIDNYESGKGDHKHHGTARTVPVEMPIIVNLPMDRDSFDLTTEVLKHRLSVLVQDKRQMKRASSTHERNGTEGHDADLAAIQKKFESLKLHLTKFCYWPINAGREKVDENTLVPNANGMYSVPRSTTNETEDDESRENNVDKFAFHEKIWESFLKNMEQESSDDNGDHNTNTVEKRLKIFRNISLSTNDHDCNSCITSESRPPHISKGNNFGECKQAETHSNGGEDEDIFFGTNDLNVNSPSSKSWKCIFDGNTNGDWDLVRSFYHHRK